MLTYRLTGTTEDSGFDRDEHKPSSTKGVACDQTTRMPHGHGIFASHGEPPKRLAGADLRLCVSKGARPIPLTTRE